MVKNAYNELNLILRGIFQVSLDVPLRKRRPGRKPRPFRNHMSRHSPIPVMESKPQVLEPVTPLMLDDVAYDNNYDDINYDEEYLDIGNVDNSLSQRKGQCSR